MKISLLEPLSVPQETIDRLSAKAIADGHSFVSYPDKTTDPSELIHRGANSDIIIIANNPFPDEVVRGCKHLKMLNVAFTGVDHVGQTALKEQKVALCNAAGYSTPAVAELAVCLALDVYRNIPCADRASRTGGTLASAGLIGNELLGKTVGIVGTGAIGAKAAKLFSAFGCKVLASSRTEKEDVKAIGVKYMQLDEMLPLCDIISLHVPVTPKTRGMIDARRLACMKSTAVLINCARGPVVDNAALADALNEEKLAGAGIDVYDMEPPIPADYPLLHAKNIILTPHLAFSTHEAMERRAEIVFQNLYSFLDGNPENIVIL